MISKLDNLILKLSSLGLSKKEIADSIGLSILELNERLDNDPLIKEAFEYNSIKTDALVMRALFKRAVGTKKKTVKTRTINRSEDAVHPQMGVVHLVKTETINDETIEDVVGDVSAQKFWLTNRRPELFSDVSIDKIKAILEDQ